MKQDPSLVEVFFNEVHITRYYLIILKRELKEDTHKKIMVFLVVGPLRFYPLYTNGLVVLATFFFCFLVFFGAKKAICFWQIFFRTNFSNQ